jgi:hypothetical protein
MNSLYYHVYIINDLFHLTTGIAHVPIGWIEVVTSKVLRSPHYWVRVLTRSETVKKHFKIPKGVIWCRTLKDRPSDDQRKKGVLRSPPWLRLPLWYFCVGNDHGYVPLVANTSRSFSHSLLTIGFVTRIPKGVIWCRTLKDRPSDDQRKKGQNY